MDRTARNLLNAAAEGDLNAAKALIPWIAQARRLPRVSPAWHRVFWADIERR